MGQLMGVGGWGRMVGRRVPTDTGVADGVVGELGAHSPWYPWCGAYGRVVRVRG